MGSLLARLRQPRTWASLVVLLLVGGLYLLSELGGSDPQAEPNRPQVTASTSPSTAPSVTASSSTGARPTFRPSARPSVRPSNRPSAPPTTGGRDAVSGLRWVAVEALPQEAGEVLTAIDDGGPFVREKDGSSFGNYEGILPTRQRGYYREYTVPTPGVSHAGARRIITGDAGEYYWTADHYETFDRIRR